MLHDANDTWVCEKNNRRLYNHNRCLVRAPHRFTLHMAYKYLGQPAQHSDTACTDSLYTSLEMGHNPCLVYTSLRTLTWHDNDRRYPQIKQRMREEKAATLGLCHP